MNFIGRAAEMERLKEWYSEPRMGFVPVYGRRRVGKSHLLIEFLKGKPGGIYYLGKQAPAQVQLQEFMETAADVLERPSLAGMNPRDWRAALDHLLEQKPRDQKLVIVLDEFQWIVESDPTLPSHLQERIDMAWRERDDLLLIVCGSFVGFMEREVLGHKSPLFGRRTGQIELKPFSYREAAGFHPRWSVEDQAKAYFICGGVPLYHKMFEPSLTVPKNIERLCFDPYNPLYREPEFLLREELREVQRYQGILMAVGLGATTNQEISTRSGVPERQLDYYLRQLRSLGYVERHEPLLPRPKPGRTSKRSRYRISDALLAFWFRFVFPHTSRIQQLGPREAFRQFGAPQLTAYFGTRFERLCREALVHIYVKDGVMGLFRIGEYWDPSVQIDVLGIHEGQRWDLGECKWGRPSAAGINRELARKEARLPNPSSLTIQARAFTRKPIPKATQKNYPHIVWHDLPELYRKK